MWRWSTLAQPSSWYAPLLNALISIKFFLTFYLFLRDRARQSMSKGGAERAQGDTDSEAGSRLRAVSAELGAGLKLMDREIMT